MSKIIRCEDLFPGCEFSVRAERESELLEKVAAHAQSAHGVTEMSEEIVAKVKSCIRDG